jgi:dUTP pyrophosphatase
LKPIVSVLLLAVRRVGPIEVPLPSYQTPGAVGLDLCAALEQSLTLAPLARQLIPTGLAIAIPEGYEGQVRPRSGLAKRFGVTIVNAPGTIDPDFRGEIGVVLINLGHEPFRVEPLARIAQLVIAPVARVKLELRLELPQTERGSGGYGSTGF